MVDFIIKLASKTALSKEPEQSMLDSQKIKPSKTLLLQPAGVVVVVSEETLND